MFLPVLADVDGSLEAIQSSLATYTSSLVKMETMASGAGEVTENDIELAQLFDGMAKYLSSASDNSKLVFSYSVILTTNYSVCIAGVP